MACSDGLYRFALLLDWPRCGVLCVFVRGLSAPARRAGVVTLDIDMICIFDILAFIQYKLQRHCIVNRSGSDWKHAGRNFDALRDRYGGSGRVVLHELGKVYLSRLQYQLGSWDIKTGVHILKILEAHQTKACSFDLYSCVAAGRYQCRHLFGLKILGVQEAQSDLRRTKERRRIENLIITRDCH